MLIGLRTARRPIIAGRKDVDDLDDVFGEPEWVTQLRGRTCTCGRGWCPYHGTDHLSDEEERLELERRDDHRGTHGGRRVLRKKIGED